MKKLFTILLSVALCGIATATTVKWSVASKSFTTSDGASERASGYLVAVFLFSDYADVMSALSSGDSAAVATAISEGEWMKSSNTTKATGASAGGSFASSEPSVTAVSIFSVAFDASKIEDASNYLVSGKILSDAYDTNSSDTPTNMGEFTSTSYSNSSWTPMVPEPSVALMGLLGIGMLLKRRKA